MGKLAFLHLGAGPPAPTVNDLLVGQHRIFHRVPIDPGFLAVRQAGLEKVQKHLLFEPVILRFAGGDFPRPVIGQAHGFQLAAHGRNVFPGPFGRVDPPFLGGVFRRQAKGVPAHGVKHVEAAGALVPGHQVAKGVVADVSHVDAAGRIGEHFEDVVLGPAGILAGGKARLAIPNGPPSGFRFLEVVARHGLAAAFVDPV